jgi:HEAT repeat protein
MSSNDNGRQDEALKRFTSREWADFINNYFGDPYYAWHDGIDENAILRLTNPEEKRAAEDMLIAALPGGMNAARGLALMHSERAIAALEKALEVKELDDVRVRIIDAIEQITHNGRHVQDLVECLQQGVDYETRMNAARALGNYRTPAVIDALLAAVADREYLVRYHACNALLSMHGFTTDISEYDDIFANILKGVSKSKFDVAKVLLQALLSSKKLRKKRSK